MNVDLNDLEFENEEYTIYEGVTYRGKPFTGVASKQGKDSYTEWRFVNGKADGRWFEQWNDGQLRGETILEMGVELEDRLWNKEGVLLRNNRREPLLKQVFFGDGSLEYEETAEYQRQWDRSGRLRRDYTYANGFELRYSFDGTWYVKYLVEPGCTICRSRDSVIFNEEYLIEHYLDCLHEDYRGFRRDFETWLPKVPKDNEPFKPSAKLSAIICGMIASDDLHIKYDGLNKAWQFRVMEAIPLIKKQLGNNATPCDISSSAFGDWGLTSYGCTISNRARTALRRLYASRIKAMFR